MRNLDILFNPRSIAVIGASKKNASVGSGIMRSLVEGGVFKNKYCKPYEGKIYPINPHEGIILKHNVYKSIKDVKSNIDLAIIAVSAKRVPNIMFECKEKKVKAIIIISAGFSEMGDKGKKLQDEVVRIAKEANITLVGPNCLGIIRPWSRLNASFAPCMPPIGNIGFISQSGALADSIIDWAVNERYGMSTIISYGNGAMLDATDFLEWLSKDKKTKAITLYLEGLKDPLRFLAAAKKVTKIKPVIVIKGGRTDEGQKAVSSHTGNLAGSYDIYEAMFKQAGIFVADTVEELFDTAKALANQPTLRQNSIAIITNGGGAGVLTADYCNELGVNLAELKESTLKKLDDSGVMHKAYSRRNPLDLVGDALPDRYKAALEILLSEDYVHGAIVLQTLQTMTNPLEDAKVIIAAHKKYPKKPIICTYMGGRYSSKGIILLEENNIPDYNDPKKAVKAMKALLYMGKYLSK